MIFDRDQGMLLVEQRRTTRLGTMAWVFFLFFIQIQLLAKWQHHIFTSFFGIRIAYLVGDALIAKHDR